ncbi:hypothetical protein [Arcobacter vandammei]|uniref:hypothetical protein n=1 Tax=Arcobacter vandammei TaxID=2782243 RepID=UPI0018DF92F3|nr:hypothetical protein [Arcobacter vandammei]
MIKILISISLLVNIAFSSNLEEDKKEIFKVLKNYATSIACGTSFEDKREIYKPEDIIYLGKDIFETEYYYAVWFGDIGCDGGSGTSANYISEIFRPDFSKKFYVNIEPVFSAKGLSDFKKVDNKLEVIEHYLLKNDANCCPSGKAKVILSKDKKYLKWDITYKQIVDLDKKIE